MTMNRIAPAQAATRFGDMLLGDRFVFNRRPDVGDQLFIKSQSDDAFAPQSGEHAHPTHDESVTVVEENVLAIL